MGQVAQPQTERKVERRTAPRFGVECWVEECIDAGVYFHRVTNLSRDGFFVAKQLPFRVGQTLWVRFDLPGFAAKPEARSRVINNYRDKQHQLCGAGFQFMELDARSRKIIEAFIRSIARPEA